jgi:hypothetical protein
LFTTTEGNTAQSRAPKGDGAKKLVTQAQDAADKERLTG